MDRSEWVLVPRVPTPEMRQAMSDCYDPTWGYPSRDVGLAWADNSHAAMIAAAPPPPAEQASGEHVALLMREADSIREELGLFPAGDPRWRAAQERRIAALNAAIAALSQRPVVSVTAEQVAAAAHAYCKDLSIVGPDDWHIRGMWAALEAAALAPQQPEKGEG